MHHAFTITYSGYVDVLTTKVGISLPMTFEEAKANENNIQQYAAIWDTGATQCNRRRKQTTKTISPSKKKIMDRKKLA
jgi:hypothetical protein